MFRLSKTYLYVIINHKRQRTANNGNKLLTIWLVYLVKMQPEQIKGFHMIWFKDFFLLLMIYCFGVTLCWTQGCHFVLCSEITAGTARETIDSSGGESRVGHRQGKSLNFLLHLWPHKLFFQEVTRTTLFLVLHSFSGNSEKRDTEIISHCLLEISQEWGGLYPQLPGAALGSV